MLVEQKNQITLVLWQSWTLPFHLLGVQCVYMLSAYLDTQLGEQSYQYLTTGEDLRGLKEEPRSRHKVVILFHLVIWIVYT